MSSAYFTSILDWIKGWVEENTERIEKACVVNGGWEHWAQTELAIYINSLDGIRVFRERYPYERFDLRIYSPLGLALVGLKCHQSNNKQTFGDSQFSTEQIFGCLDFVNSMWEDVEKVKSMDDELKDCPFIVVGLIPSQAFNINFRAELQKRVKNGQEWEVVEAVAGSNIWILAMQVFEGVCW